MKYIRAQDGQIYSVSQLMSPSKAILYTKDNEKIWRLSLITIDGHRQIYATYNDQEVASAEYEKVVGFMASEEFLLIFELGIEGQANVESPHDLDKRVSLSSTPQDGD